VQSTEWSQRSLQQSIKLLTVSYYICLASTPLGWLVAGMTSESVTVAERQRGSKWGSYSDCTLHGLSADCWGPSTHSVITALLLLVAAGGDSIKPINDWCLSGSRHSRSSSQLCTSDIKPQQHHNAHVMWACCLACLVALLAHQDTFCQAWLFISLVLYTWQMRLEFADRPRPQK